VNAAPDNVITLPGAAEQLVNLSPSSSYTGTYIRHDGMHVFKAPKVRVLFRILEHPDIVLPRWYRVTTYKGRVSAPIHSDLVRELTVVLGQRVRHDRVPVGSLANIVVNITVSTVTRSSTPEPLHILNQYSVISSVDGRV
jgi:hypothetical protein